MDLNLNTFTKNSSLNEKKAATIASRIELSGPIADDEQLAKEFISMMDLILANYDFDYDCVLKLKNEICSCGHKLQRKDTFKKQILLPGGSEIHLEFYRYYCNHCKQKVNRKLNSIFEDNKQYSKNVKSDAIRLYSKQLSSYELVTEELNKIYTSNIDKKTVRLWLMEAGMLAETKILKDNDFSGHLVYDEEFINVYNGDVGCKDAKLDWVKVYLLLFRDSITKKVIIKFSDDLSENSLVPIWKEVILDLAKKGIEVKSFGTDGKREYKSYIKTINSFLNMNIHHVYDAFHFGKNSYENANYELFGNKQSKKELPENIINQIEQIYLFFNAKNKKHAKEIIDKLVFEKNTFIKSLRNQISRLKNNFEDYTYYLDVPSMKTTNLCEGWFGRTKPKKIKREYKTRLGLKAISNMLALKINYNWKIALNMDFDYTNALNGLLGLVKAKYQFR